MPQTSPQMPAAAPLGTTAPLAAPLTDQSPFAVIVNDRSGTNARDREALTRAIDGLGADRVRRYEFSSGDDIGATVRRAVADGAQAVVAAGGDGTAMAVAGAVLETGRAFSHLPLGTFNYFARGIGLPEDPYEAAREIANGEAKPIEVGTVNGRVFLNNASIGVYPAILREREAIYARYGRRRIMAHWSVAKTFWKFQHPMRLDIVADGRAFSCRSPLLFVFRSAYQLETFGLKGGQSISDDQFAVLIGRGNTRADLFRTAMRLVTRTAEIGRDYDFLAARDLSVTPNKRRLLLAFDGERDKATAPLTFKMSAAPLNVIMPRPKEAP
jgi:diacylglycerol kinase family enzyme